MFERMTETVRRAIFRARKEAHERRCAAIGTEHLLFGVVREDDPILREFIGLNLEDIRQQLKFAGERQPDLHEDLPLGDEAKQALKFAVQEADSIGDWIVGTQHLLAGLLLVPESQGAIVLAESALTLERVREAIAKLPRQ